MLFESPGVFSLIVHLAFSNLRASLVVCGVVEMAGAGCGSMMVAVCVLLALVSAQVTFSRDWSGGKRSVPVAFDCGQFARLCRQFIHELKQEISTDKIGKRRRAESPPAPPSPDDANADDTIAYDD